MISRPYVIKVLEAGNRSWTFRTPYGANRMRVHATRFDTEREALHAIDADRSEHPDWVWKVIPLARE